MATITFGGLASGLDTDSIIESLMEIESQPLDRLETDKSYQQSRLDAYTELDGLLSALQTAMEDLDTLDELSCYAATASNSSYLQVSTTSSAQPGTYNMEVVSLAQVQKDIAAEGFADKTSQTLSGTLTIGDEEISYDGVSLTELAEMINDADTGITAMVVNDGTENGYRLMFQGTSAESEIDIVGTGSLTIDTVTDGHTQDAQQAHVLIDGIDFYSSSNTLEDAIPGLSIDLLQVNDDGDTTRITVDTDTDAIEAKIDEFVSAYNEIITFIADQSDASWGRDSELMSVKRKLQSMITTPVGTSGSFTYLAELGFETDKEDGTLSVDSETLSDALNEDFESVAKLFIGEDDVKGIASQLASYLDGKTDSVDGLLATRTTSTEANIKRIDAAIERMELRLEKREENLRAQYTALEELMSTMNSQYDYMTQALSSD